jgi:hypothetical protein
MRIAAMAGLAGAILASVLADVAVAQQARQDFTLVNRTGYDLSHVYVAPTKSDDWGEDIMGQDIVPDGATVNVTFSRAASTCRWDLKVDYADDDSSAYWTNIDLCSVSRITIRYDRRKDETSATFD